MHCLSLAEQGEGGSNSELMRCPQGLIDGHDGHNDVLQHACRAVLQLTPSQTAPWHNLVYKLLKTPQNVGAVAFPNC